MINQQLLEGLSQQISQLMDSAREISTAVDVQPQVEALLKGAFNRMDLVTRDQFDAQAAVLARTRTKLEQLERQLAELEQDSK
ncbi:accessory factor UbiK family protein [Amphritea sp. HPY]|uniref:accessory factor UbiK family protein n=1 Tax=Amphritea sp. HPY TaxID=3421652 RepID=UPI003D7E239D